MKKYIYLILLNGLILLNINTITAPTTQATSQEVAQAIAAGNIPLLRSQYASNPNLFAQTVYSNLSPLMYALYDYSSNSTLLNFLMNLPTVRASLNDYKDSIGRTAIFVAIEHASLKIILQLISLGANLNVTDNYQTSPLDIIPSGTISTGV